jgi:hypothetical protein
MQLTWGRKERDLRAERKGFVGVGKKGIEAAIK